VLARSASNFVEEAMDATGRLRSVGIKFNWALLATTCRQIPVMFKVFADSSGILATSLKKPDLPEAQQRS